MASRLARSSVFCHGTTVAVHGAGGGGYGDPGKREREGLERDLEEGYVTKDGARRDYGADES